MTLLNYVDVPGMSDVTKEEVATEADVDDFFTSIHFDISILDQYERIYVLVSGGYDSTLLADYIFRHYPDKTWFLNCYNPFEVNKTLVHFSRLPNYIQVKPPEKLDYAQILETAFKNLPEGFMKRCQDRYSKKVFACCYYIKHKTYKADPRFKEPTVCCISGIKDGDGMRRHAWLEQLRTKLVSFIHVHKGGQTYVYPYRDYNARELPESIQLYLQLKYPNISHSGCRICPVLVLFKITESPQYKESAAYAKKLGIDISMFERQIQPSIKKRFIDVKEKRQHQLFDFLDTPDDMIEEDEDDYGAEKVEETGEKACDVHYPAEQCKACRVLEQFPCGKVCATCKVQNPDSTVTYFQKSWHHKDSPQPGQLST